MVEDVVETVDVVVEEVVELLAVELAQEAL